MSTTEILRKFYEHGNDFFILIRENGIILVEGPEEHAREGPRETLLRLFLNVDDATRYRDRSNYRDETRVMKITLVGLWNLLSRIDALSMSQFDAPIRIEVAYMPDGKDVQCVDTLHSIYELPS